MKNRVLNLKFLSVLFALALVFVSGCTVDTAISVTVFDESGEPIPDLSVALEDSYGNQIRNQPTNSEGVTDFSFGRGEGSSEYTVKTQSQFYVNQEELVVVQDGTLSYFVQFNLEWGFGGPVEFCGNGLDDDFDGDVDYNDRDCVEDCSAQGKVLLKTFPGSGSGAPLNFGFDPERVNCCATNFCLDSLGNCVPEDSESSDGKLVCSGAGSEDLFSVWCQNSNYSANAKGECLDVLKVFGIRHVPDLLGASGSKNLEKGSYVTECPEGKKLCEWGPGREMFNICVDTDSCCFEYCFDGSGNASCQELGKCCIGQEACWRPLPHSDYIIFPPYSCLADGQCCGRDCDEGCKAYTECCDNRTFCKLSESGEIAECGNPCCDGQRKCGDGSCVAEGGEECCQDGSDDICDDGKCIPKIPGIFGDFDCCEGEKACYTNSASTDYCAVCCEDDIPCSDNECISKYEYGSGPNERCCSDEVKCMTEEGLKCVPKWECDNCRDSDEGFDARSTAGFAWNIDFVLKGDVCEYISDLNDDFSYRIGEAYCSVSNYPVLGFSDCPFIGSSLMSRCIEVDEVYDWKEMKPVTLAKCVNLTCVDSDGLNDYGSPKPIVDQRGTSGTVTVSYEGEVLKEISDKCDESGRNIFEAACYPKGSKGPVAGYNLYGCPWGTTCSDGNCTNPD